MGVQKEKWPTDTTQLLGANLQWFCSLSKQHKSSPHGLKDGEINVSDSDCLILSVVDFQVIC